jgi:uncharacterized membrane protein
MDPSADVGDPSRPAKRKRNIMIGSAVVALLLLCGLIASIAYVKTRSNNVAVNDAALVYPGSQTVVDFSSGDGRTLHLQTTDSLEKVVAWYERASSRRRQCG